MNINGYSIFRPGIYLQSPEIQANPFPTYSFLREHYPVCQIEPDGMWAISRFKDVQFVLSNPEIFSSEAIDFSYESDWLREECRTPRLIVAQDPPEHKRYHGMVNKAFVNNAINSLIPLMCDTAQSLIPNFEGTEPIDFIEHFSYPYIGKIIRHIVGLGEKQSLAELREWVELEERVRPTRPDDEFLKAYEKAVLRQKNYFMEVLDERKGSPQDDLITHLINTKIDDEYLSEKELTSLLSLLVTAGFATTIQALNHAVILLSRRSDLMARLIDSPPLIPAFIEELLRYSPSLLSSIRVTTQNVNVNGVTVPKGELVVPLIASANRDPAAFQNPDTFDLGRQRIKQHLSFGHGIHTCIGAALARLEMRIALETLLSAYSRFDCPGDDQLIWIDSIFVRGFSELPVSFS